MSDEYEVVQHDPKPEPAALPVPDGLEVREPRTQRTVSDATRKAFQALVAKHADGPVESNELVPVDTAPKPADKPAETGDDLVPVDTTAAAATAPPPTAPPVAAAAPIVEQRASAADAAARALAEQQLKDREAELTKLRESIEAERKTYPSRDAWLDKPAETFESLVKGQLGLTDEEYKDFAADFISEYTSKQLGAPLDSRIKDGIDARRAKLSVRTYTAEQKRQAEAIKAEQQRIMDEARKERETAERVANEERAKGALRGMLTGTNTEFPFLHANHDGLDPADVVFEVLKSQRDQFVKQHGEGAANQFRPDWKAAAGLANTHYKNHYDRYSTLLAPTPPAPAKPSPQVSAQVPRSTTPQPKPEATQPAPTDSPITDWRTERAARRRQSLEKRFSGATPEE